MGSHVLNAQGSKRFVREHLLRSFENLEIKRLHLLSGSKDQTTDHEWKILKTQRKLLLSALLPLYRDETAAWLSQQSRTTATSRSIWWSIILDSEVLTLLYTLGLGGDEGRVYHRPGEALQDVLITAIYMAEVRFRHIGDGVPTTAALGIHVVSPHVSTFQSKRQLEADTDYGQKVNAYLDLLSAQMAQAENDKGENPRGLNLPDDFIQAVAMLIEQRRIDRNTFSVRSLLDVKIYDRIMRLENWHPKEETCKAILFALRPSVITALRLYALAGYTFRECEQDRLLLAMFGIGDYDIETYNQVMLQRHGKPLGSKSKK